MIFLRDLGCFLGLPSVPREPPECMLLLVRLLLLSSPLVYFPFICLERGGLPSVIAEFFFVSASNTGAYWISESLPKLFCVAEGYDF